MRWEPPSPRQIKAVDGPLFCVCLFVICFFFWHTFNTQVKFNSLC